MMVKLSTTNTILNMSVQVTACNAYIFSDLWYWGALSYDHQVALLAILAHYK